MNPNVSNQISENPIKEWLLELIKGIRNLGEFSWNIAELPDELREIVDELEKKWVNFSEIETSRPLLSVLIDEYNANFATWDKYHEKISYPIDATKKVVSETVTLSLEAQEVQKKFDSWCDNNQDYVTRHKIKENVKIWNNGIELWGKILKWSWHTFWGVDVKNDADLNKQPYTIQEMWAMMEALWGEVLQLKDGYKLWGSEISSFLSGVANVDIWRFYWSSSRHVNYDSINLAWGVSVDRSGVYVNWPLRSNGHSSLSSEN